MQLAERTEILASDDEPDSDGFGGAQDCRLEPAPNNFRLLTLSFALNGVPESQCIDRPSVTLTRMFDLHRIPSIPETANIEHWGLRRCGGLYD